VRRWHGDGRNLRWSHDGLPTRRQAAAERGRAAPDRHASLRPYHVGTFQREASASLTPNATSRSPSSASTSRPGGSHRRNSMTGQGTRWRPGPGTSSAGCSVTCRRSWTTTRRRPRQRQLPRGRRRGPVATGRPAGSSSPASSRRSLSVTWRATSATASAPLKDLRKAYLQLSLVGQLRRVYAVMHADFHV
jgi:hypothetical protein